MTKMIIISLLHIDCYIDFSSFLVTSLFRDFRLFSTFGTTITQKSLEKMCKFSNYSFLL